MHAAATRIQLDLRHRGPLRLEPTLCRFSHNFFIPPPPYAYRSSFPADFSPADLVQQLAFNSAPLRRGAALLYHARAHLLSASRDVPRAPFGGCRAMSSPREIMRAKSKDHYAVNNAHDLKALSGGVAVITGGNTAPLSPASL